LVFLFWIATRGKNMKRILLTTTSLVLAAGVAQAEVTFSGKAEAGISRTEKAAAVAAVAGVENEAFAAANSTEGGTPLTTGVDIKAVAATGATADASDATTLAAANAALAAARSDLNDIVVAMRDASAETSDNNAAVVADIAAGSSAAILNALDDALALAKARVYAAEVALAAEKGTKAVAAGAAGDMVAYSGYDMDVTVSSTLDNGMVVSAAFDMGAGSIADRDDDRVLDAQAAAVALSAVTIKNGGVTYVVGQNKVDDLYDDTQNGDVSVSGAMGGISYTLVADLDKDTKAVAASSVWTAAGTAGDGTSTFVETAAVAAVHESTSLKLSGAAAGVTWSFVTTNKDDFGDAASRVSLGYAAGDALSFNLTHDTDGAAEAINTLKATYTMDAISLTVSGSDDKNHARNTNTGGKASQNMTIAYANGPLTASFNNDESSAVVGNNNIRPWQRCGHLRNCRPPRVRSCRYVLRILSETPLSKERAALRRRSFLLWHRVMARLQSQLHIPVHTAVRFAAVRC
jgi:hypothetical protein